MTTFIILAHAITDQQTQWCNLWLISITSSNVTGLNITVQSNEEDSPVGPGKQWLQADLREVKVVSDPG